MPSEALTVAEQRTKAWLDSFVVGLNLCPFARPVIVSEGLRLTLNESSQVEGILHGFLTELELISSSDETEIATTLLVVPNALANFEEYLGFVELAEELIEEADLEGVIQLASFHPDYRFDGEPEDSASHFTNRSPYPMIHFLREEMMERVLGEFPDSEQIPQQNIQTLETIGRSEIERRWNSLEPTDSLK